MNNEAPFVNESRLEIEDEEGCGVDSEGGITSYRVSQLTLN